MIRHKHTIPNHAMPCHDSHALAWLVEARQGVLVPYHVCHVHHLFTAKQGCLFGGEIEA